MSCHEEDTPKGVRSRARLAWVALGASLAWIAACSTPGQTPTGSASGRPATAAPSVERVASSGPPTSEAGAPDATERELAPGSSAVAGIERLPPGGAFYAAVKPAFLERVLSLLPNNERRGLVREIERELPGASRGIAGAVGRELGIDETRFVLVSALAPDSTAVGEAMARIAKAGSSADYTAATKRARDLAAYYRFVLPLRRGVDPTKAIRLIAEHIARTGQVQPCPAAKGCSAFGSGTPSAVGTGNRGAFAAFADAESVVVDVAVPLFVDVPDAELWKPLAAWRASPAGGPAGSRCAWLDGSADATACVDADAMADLALASGYGLVARALAGDAVDPAVRTRIAAQGQSEAGKARVLAKPSKRLLDDGTIDVRSVGGRVRFRASWAIEPAFRKSLAEAFPAERCVDRAGSESRPLLEELRSGFGGLGADFTNPKARVRDVQEAGWGAWPILFARTWPNFLGLDELLTPEREVAKVLDRAKLCVSVRDDRLVIATHALPQD